MNDWTVARGEVHLFSYLGKWPGWDDSEVLEVYLSNKWMTSYPSDVPEDPEVGRVSPFIKFPNAHILYRVPDNFDGPSDYVEVALLRCDLLHLDVLYYRGLAAFADGSMDKEGRVQIRHMNGECYLRCAGLMYRKVEAKDVEDAYLARSFASAA